MRIGLSASEETFYQDLLVGHVHKDLIRVILEESGYEVYPYGYESFLTAMKIKFEKGEIRSTEVSKKIRCTPDLLVYDPDDESVELLEVKSRRWDHTDDVLIDAIPKYRKYWRESVMVVILPAGHFFYAQRVEKLQSGEDSFDLNKEFKWFEKIFTKVKLDTLCSYKSQIVNFWDRNKKHYDPVETPMERFSLCSLIEELGKCEVDELFLQQNERNLMSRKDFDEAIKILIDEGQLIKKGGIIRSI